MEITLNRAKYFAPKLMGRNTSDDIKKFVPSFMEKGVDSNSHQVDIDSSYLIIYLSIIYFIFHYCWWIFSFGGEIVHHMMREIAF